MGRTLRVSASALTAAAMVATNALAAPPVKCARPVEVTAIQAAAIQQQLMVAALTCNEISRFNAFQTSYGPELRASDQALERMFKRLFGGSQGEAQYHAFKTRLANNSSMRSISNNPDYCRVAGQVFEAALGANKPTLADFVGGVPVTDPSPVGSCTIQVATGLVGVKVAPNVVPKPNPLRMANNNLGFPDDPSATHLTPTLTPPPLPSQTAQPAGNH